MKIREWAVRQTAKINERSEWPTYSPKKRIWAAVGLSVEALLVCMGGAWLLDRAFDDTLALSVTMVIAFVFSLALFWSLALVPDRALGWFVVWGTPLVVVTTVVAVAMTEALR